MGSYFQTALIYLTLHRILLSSFYHPPLIFPLTYLRTTPDSVINFAQPPNIIRILKRRSKVYCIYPHLYSFFPPDVLRFLFYHFLSLFRTSFSQSFKVNLLVTNPLNFLSPENVLKSLSFQKDIFAGYMVLH